MQIRNPVSLQTMLDVKTGQAAGEALRVLLVEDVDDDAALVERALHSAGYRPIVRRVQTEEAFRAALAEGPWDVVISDHSLPRFSSTAALAFLHDQRLDLPFIVVSGTIDEESAVSILRAGAHDFVTKQSLARLGPAIRREMQDAQIRTERKDAQRDLQLQRDFFRLVLDTTPNLIFVKNWVGRFTLANRAVADLYGTTVEELVGRTDRDFKADLSEIERFSEADRDVMKTRRSRVASAEPITDVRTGELRWFEIRRVPLVMPDGTPHVLGIGAEITDQRTAEEALRVSEEQFRQAQKMEAVGQLAGGIAHDFNNLLTAILGYSDLVSDQVRDRPALAKDVDEIRKAGERAKSLTAQLLAFSRKQVLEPQVLDLNMVVAEAERILRRVIGEDVHLETAVDPELRRVKADPGQIHQVLMNLAVNARDAMPRGGTLRLTTANGAMPSSPTGKARVPCATLSVSDTGFGIPPHVRTRIFEPFFTTKGQGKGTGLGLSMVHGVVTQSGGQIEVESEPGQGTTFTIYLPAAAAEEAEPYTPRLHAAELRGSETILLVDDERSVRELARKILIGYGYNVLDGGDATQAMEIAQHHSERIDLLLTDIVMPRISGPELAQRLVPLRPEMRVLYMSGFVNRLGASYRNLDMNIGLLHKPFTAEGLAQKVRDCLNLQASN